MCPFLIKKLCFSVSALPQGPFFSQNHGNRGTEPAPVPTEPTERNPVSNIFRGDADNYVEKTFMCRIYVEKSLTEKFQVTKSFSQ